MRSLAKIDRDWLDKEVNALRHMLETKQDDLATTQHLRGQIATFRKVIKYVDDLNAKPEPAPGPQAPVAKEANLY